MAKTFTHKPCPGCGLNKELAPQTVCRECKQAIVDAKKLRAYADMAAHSTTIGFNHKMLPFRLRDFPDAERFFDSFINVLTACCPPAEGGRMVNLRYHSGVDLHCGVLEPSKCFTVASYEAENAIGAFFTVVNGFLAVAEAQGKIQGQDFLAQLAAGELSMGQINQKVADANRLLSKDR